MNDEVYFWPLQVDTIILGVPSQACPKYPKYEICISLQYLKKNVGDEVDFLLADKHESLLQIGSVTWVCMARHAQCTQNKKFTISLQYLKENVRNKIFCLQINIKGFFKLIPSF